MAKLSIYLPPFAADYSGAASMLFNLNCVNVIVDASCCTHNYISYDEPRWSTNASVTISAQLRTLEATLGSDSRMLSQIQAAVKQTNAQCVSLIGTPVPALVGMDLRGMALELENNLGLPVLAIDSTGFGTYNIGASNAQTELLRKFLPPEASTTQEIAGRGASSNSFNKSKSTAAGVNILGACIHDYASANTLEVLENFICESGVETAFSTATPYELSNVSAAANASESVVVSHSGIEPARFLHKQFSVPYKAQVLKPALLKLAGAGEFLEQAQEFASKASGSIELLIIHDQIIANSLRNCLLEQLKQCGVQEQVQIRIASFFGMDSEFAQPGDFCIKDEACLISYVKQHPSVAIAADGMLANIPQVKPHLCWQIKHWAVSSSAGESG